MMQGSRLLKGQGLSWLTITQQFPGRTSEAVAARYHAKLKSHGAPQLCGEPQIPSVVDDPGEGEREGEKICSHREPEDNSQEFLAKWKGGEENVANTRSA
jgi:hypothetical protein